MPTWAGCLLFMCCMNEGLEAEPETRKEDVALEKRKVGGWLQDPRHSADLGDFFKARAPDRLEAEDKGPHPNTDLVIP